MSEINKTIRLALSGADFLHSVNSVPSKMEAKAIRELVAKASETCEWKQSKDWDWDTACGKYVATMCGDFPSSRGYKFCPYCGRKLIESKHEQGNKERT